MAFVHTALDEATAGPEVWRLVGPKAPAPAKKLAAQGLAPLPPRHMLTALYQLWVDPSEAESAAATKTVESLPSQIIEGALRDTTLPPGVIDLVARKFPRDEALLILLVRHSAVQDETLAAIARHCPETICDLIADNQVRWLAAPAIVESLYQNPNCRMSVAQRMIELAVREGVELALPNMDEIRQAIGAGTNDTEEANDDEDDASFRSASSRIRRAQDQDAKRLVNAPASEDLATEDLQDETEVEAEMLAANAVLGPGDDNDEPAEEAPDTVEASPAPDEAKDNITIISKLKPMAKIRMALMGSAFERSVLIRDANKAVCMSAIKSPRVRENEVEKYAANRSLSHDVVRYIARRRDWTKNYSIKLQLVLNPKTPMALAMGFLVHLRAHDIRKVGRSKNIPSALATAAKRRMERRR